MNLPINFISSLPNCTRAMPLTPQRAWTDGLEPIVRDFAYDDFRPRTAPYRAACTDTTIQVHRVFTKRWALVRVGRCLPDFTTVVVLRVGLRGLEADACGQSFNRSGVPTAVGGVFSLTVEKPGAYMAYFCTRDDARPIARIRAVPLPRPSFRCGPLFHKLCPEDGVTGSISATDAHLVQQARLRIFIYDNLSPEFHWALFRDGMPSNVKSATRCDFIRSACTPQNKGLYRKRHRSHTGARWIVFNEYGKCVWHCVSYGLGGGTHIDASR